MLIVHNIRSIDKLLSIVMSFVAVEEAEMDLKTHFWRWFDDRFSGGMQLKTTFRPSTCWIFWKKTTPVTVHGFFNTCCHQHWTDFQNKEIKQLQQREIKDLLWWKKWALEGCVDLVRFFIAWTFFVCMLLFLGGYKRLQKTALVVKVIYGYCDNVGTKMLRLLATTFQRNPVEERTKTFTGVCKLMF